MKKVQILFLAGARRQAKDAAAWWDENRPEARGLFRRELAGEPRGAAFQEVQEGAGG